MVRQIDDPSGAWRKLAHVTFAWCGALAVLAVVAVLALVALTSRDGDAILGGAAVSVLALAGVASYKPPRPHA